MAKSKPYPELEFERRNKNLQKIPKNARVEKRPIPHASIASPYAGSSVPKVVYVATKTPFMSAAKRVQKLLRQAEKRSTANVDLSNSKVSEKEKLERVFHAHETLRKEAVYIRATGRAIDRAMSIGKWFQDKDEEYEIRVETGSVLVVDDIVVDQEQKEREDKRKNMDGGNSPTDEGLGEGHEEEDDDSANVELKDQTIQLQGDKDTGDGKLMTSSKKRKRNSKEKRLDSVEPPESRTRYVNSVKIAVMLK